MSKGKRLHAWHYWAHYNQKRSDFYSADNAPDTWGSRITYDYDSDLTLKITDSEVIWSMEGFKDQGPEKKKWTEFRFSLNITEKEKFPFFYFFPHCLSMFPIFRFSLNITEQEWFPLIVIAGCNDYNKSAVEIVHSNIGS